MELLKIFITVSILLDPSVSETIKICKDTTQKVQISCGENSLIRVDSATAMFNKQPSCDPGVIGLGGNPPAACRKPQEEILRRCYGREVCELNSTDAEESASGCEGSQTTNFLLVLYTCLPVPQSSQARIPIASDVTGAELHIFSPRFPDAMPPGQYQFSCSVTPSDAQEIVMTFTIRRIVVSLNATSSQCLESLRLRTERVDVVYCNFREDWNIEEDHQGAPSLSITYIKQKPSYGGKFWLGITGTNAQGSSVNLKLTCPDQSQIPGFTTEEPPQTPAPMQTASPNKETTTTDQAGTEEDSSETLWYGVAGAAVGVLLIVVAVVCFILCRARKSKSSGSATDDQDAKQENRVLYSDLEIDNLEQKAKTTENVYQDGDEGMYSTVNEGNPKPHANPGGGIYSTVDDTDGSKVNAAFVVSDDDGAYATVGDNYQEDSQNDENDGVNEETGETYAVVDKAKKTLGEKEEDTEEPLDMYANIDRKAKAEGSGAKGLDIEEDTIMCENEDLYEASQDLVNNRIG